MGTRPNIALLASAAALGLATPAAAQQWRSIDQRQAQIDERIDAGIRDGSLTSAEAARLRAEFRDLIVLETEHRRSGGGLDARERADLDQRYDALSARVYTQRRDAQARPGPGGPGPEYGGPGPVPGGPGGPGGWQSINQRQVQLDARIDQGVRDGSLSRPEAIRLRSEFSNIAALEAQYRRTGGGLDPRERADLDRRFDALSAQIRVERRDGQGRPGRPGGWWNINERQAELDRRIDRGVRDGSLMRAEAARLRSEFRTLVQLEDRYRRSNGLSDVERADLNRRFDLLARRIRWERSDWDRR